MCSYNLQLLNTGSHERRYVAAIFLSLVIFTKLMKSLSAGVRMIDRH